MTDRFNTLTVTLAHDVREDDAATLLSAISQLRGVLSVSGNVADLRDELAQQRAAAELREKILPLLYPDRARKA